MGAICLKDLSLTIASACPPNTDLSPVPTDMLIVSPLNLGDFVPDPSGAGETILSSQPAGLYSVSYQGGAFKNGDNPCPDPEWKVVGYFYQNTGISPLQDICSVSVCGATQAAVEATMGGIGAVKGGGDHQGGNLGIQGPPTIVGPFTAGTPNPTFRIQRTHLYQTEPVRVRIKNFADFVLAVQICPTCTPIIGTEWDGTFTLRSVSAYVATWIADYGTMPSIKGFEISNLRVTHQTAGYNHWLVFLRCYDNGSDLLVWSGIKDVGLTPEGTYMRDDGCSADPACVVLESY